jgi:hypothetical protein
MERSVNYVNANTIIIAGGQVMKKAALYENLKIFSQHTFL